MVGAIGAENANRRRSPPCQACRHFHSSCDRRVPQRVTARADASRLYGTRRFLAGNEQRDTPYHDEFWNNFAKLDLFLSNLCLGLHDIQSTILLYTSIRKPPSGTFFGACHKQINEGIGVHIRFILTACTR